MATAGRETASAGRTEGTTEEPGMAGGQASRGRAEEEEGEGEDGDDEAECEVGRAGAGEEGGAPGLADGVDGAPRVLAPVVRDGRGEHPSPAFFSAEGNVHVTARNSKAQTLSRALRAHDLVVLGLFS